MKQISPYLKELMQSGHLKKYPKGQTIIYQDDTTRDVYIIRSGYVKVYDIDKQGNEKILHILRPTALMPFVFFSGPDSSTHWFYGALTDCEVAVFSYDQIKTAERQHPELYEELVRSFSLEVHEMLNRLSSLGKSSAKVKIMAALRFLCAYTSKEQADGWCQVDFPVNHQLLADITGLTRESAAMIMKELGKKELVRNPRQTVLQINSKKLAH